MTRYIGIAMIIVGVASVVWGLPATHRFKGFLGVLVSLTVLFGVIVALLGSLIAAVPGFF